MTALNKRAVRRERQQRQARGAGSALVLVAAVACSHHSPPRPLAEHLAAEQCAVDDQYVFVAADGGALFKVDRKTGATTFLTDDTRFIRTLLPVDGSLYWLDEDGVHAWDPGATTRRNVADFSKERRGDTSTIVLFRGQVCWGRDVPPPSGTYTWHVAIDCFDLTSKRVAPWITVEGLGVVELAAADRFYAAVARSPNETIVLDVSDPLNVKVIESYPKTMVGFATTPAGPVAVNVADDLHQEPASIWIALPRPHDVSVPSDTASITTIAGQTYLTENAAVTKIDLASGKLTPIAATYDGVLCGDARDLFVRQHDSAKHDSKDDALLDLPNRQTRGPQEGPGGQHGR